MLSTLCVCLSVRNSESEVWIKSRNSGFSQSCLLTSWSSSPDSALFRLLAALAASMLDVHLRIIHGLFSHPFSLSLLVATNNWSFLSKCLTRSLRFFCFYKDAIQHKRFHFSFILCVLLFVFITSSCYLVEKWHKDAFSREGRRVSGF